MRKILAITGTLTLCLIAVGLGIWTALNDPKDKPPVETRSSILPPPYIASTTTMAPEVGTPTSIVKTTTTLKRTTTTTAKPTTTTSTTVIPQYLIDRIPGPETTECPMECVNMSEETTSTTFNESACGPSACLPNS
jgi:hypothetical protein